VISPDQVRVRLTGLQFVNDRREMQRISLGSDCVVTYDKAAPSLSTRLDCPFEVEAGTFVTLGLEFSATVQVLIDDEANGLFTDPASPTLMSSTRPEGGAAFVDIVVLPPDSPDTWTQSTHLATPVVVTPEQQVNLDIVMHGLHTMELDVTDGTPRFPTEGPRGPLRLYPSANGVSTSEYYTSVGSAGSFALQSVSSFVQVALFYETATEPAGAMFSANGALDGCGDNGIPVATNAAAETWQLNERNERPGGYLGLDGDTLCWAQGVDQTYGTYSAIFSLTRLASEGATGTLSCQSTSSPPPPASGTTYSSGCPELAAPQQIEVMLVAN
jgi:hypothetical protein